MRFVLLGVVAAALVVVQGIRNGSFQKSLYEAINNIRPQVNVNLPAPVVTVVSQQNTPRPKTGTAPPSGPTQANPVSPNPTPTEDTPKPSINQVALHAVNEAADNVQSLDGFWRRQYFHCYNLMGGRDKPGAHDEIKRRLTELEHDTVAKWSVLEPNLIDAHPKAIAFLVSPGPHEMTDKEVDEDSAAFDSAMGTAGASVTYDQIMKESVDENKFGPLLSYFNSLRTKIH